MANKRICYSDFDPCPCKIFDLDKETVYCNFTNIFAAFLINDNENNSKTTNFFLKKICPEIRTEVLHHDYRARQLQKQEKEFLEKVKPGDICFCTAEIENVVFLEHPSNIYGDVKYKTIDGKIDESPALCFSISSIGNKCARYVTKNRKRIESYERLARMNGFRVEIQKLNDKIILKIFGDSKEEVENFVSNLNSNLVLDDLYGL